MTTKNKRENENIKCYMYELREWALSKTQGGFEPPWSYYQYMKLIETINAIFDIQQHIVCVDLPFKTEHSHELDEHQGNGLRLVVDNERQETSQLRLNKSKVILPT